MKLQGATIRGFRSLAEVVVPIDGVTTLIGPNGSGKSSILAALQLFFSPRSALDARDFWRGEDNQAATEVSITLSFSELADLAQSAFRPHMNHDGSLVVERFFESAGLGRYLAERASVPEFAAIRNLPKGHRDAYNKLVGRGTYPGLQTAASKDQAFEHMTEWEMLHPEACVRQAEVVNFLAEPPGSERSLLTYINLFYIGAMEDPAQHLGTSSKGAIGELIQGTVDTTELQQNLHAIHEEVSTQRDQAFASFQSVLDGFRSATSPRLDLFAPGFSIGLAFDDVAELANVVPPLHVTIRGADGLDTDLEYQGHGVQRSLMYAILTTRAAAQPVPGARTVVLAIEEPEAFQHPLSGRVLSRVLQQLATRGYQVVYSTHSASFIQPNAISGLRVVRRHPRGEPGVGSQVDAFDINAFTDVYALATGRPSNTVASTRARLEAQLERRVLEGLFARCCVLVEGDEDEALIRGAAAARAIDLDERGIAIIQTRGKTAMPLLLAFLLHAGLRCYPIFDLDRQKRDTEQQRSAENALMALIGRNEGELADSTISEAFSCWEHNFGVTVSTEFGAAFEGALQEVCADLGYAANQGRKVAPVLQQVLHRSYEQGLSSKSLDRVLDFICDLERRA